MRKELKEIVEESIYRYGKPHSFLQKLRVKYIQPNTNCIYLCYLMWDSYSRGGVNRFFSKLLYLRIWRKYGCCIFPSAKVGREFYIMHPVGIVIGNCVIGDNFSIYQNTTIGVRYQFDDSHGRIPHIGHNVKLCANAIILGDISVCDDSIIGAGAVVLQSIMVPGTYVGTPARRVDKDCKKNPQDSKQ